MRLCVFCGSRAGNGPAFAEAARALGKRLAGEGIELVYGGGHVGLMGIVADAVLDHGGVVHGIIPRQLADKELAHDRVTHLHIVETMHERKTMMADLSDGFIALPGGIGTLEEIFEQWTWAQLSIHRKPCAFLDVEDYYEPLKQMTAGMVANGFLLQDHADMVAFAESPDEVLAHFRAYAPPTAKWVGLGGKPKP